MELLLADPELGEGLPPQELAQARRLLVVPQHDVPRGAWRVEEILEEPSLGLLVLDGLITVNVVIGNRVASHLVGPGDVLHAGGAPDALVPVEVAHVVSEPAEVAVLDRRFIAAARRWPSLLLAMNERQRLVERRLAVNAAISKLRHVEDRLVALLWHLAERWGRVSASGVTVPLNLSHGALGQLTGAERPTVSLALKALAERGEVRRREDGAFLLPQASPGLAALGADAPARRLQPLGVVRTALDAEPEPARPVTTIDVDALRRRIAALHEQLPERARATDDLLERSRAASHRSAKRRARSAAVREPD